MTHAWLIILLILVTAAVVLGTYTVGIAPRRLTITHVELPLADLAPEFDGYTIAVLTDLHYGLVHREVIARAVEATLRQTPNLIVLLGDFAAGLDQSKAYSRWIYDWALPRLGLLVGRLEAPDGVVAVLGNHDYDRDAGDVRAWLDALDVRVLINDHLTIQRGQGHLVIAGVDDEQKGHVDPLIGCTADRSFPRVILSHNPDGMLHLHPEARVDLMLSGHTHGGQVVLPILGAMVRNCRICTPHRTSGWIPNGHAPLFVSRGIGASIPVRFRCSPELPIVHLRRVGGASPLSRAGHTP